MFSRTNLMIPRFLVFMLTLGLLASPFASAVAQTPAASPVASPAAFTEPVFEESECMYDLPNGLTEDDVVCGWVTAPMYPDADRPESVTLPIIRILAHTDTPAAEPLMILLGGPGQNMSAVLPLFGDDVPEVSWNYMLERQDVILFDQRGMGFSTPSLACPFEQVGADPETNTNLGFALIQCGGELKNAGIDPAAFTTGYNAADIEAIRVAMGFDQVDLYGISYGSKLALSAIRDYPDSIRSTVIASPLPLEVNPFAGQTIGFDQALKQVWDACAADAECAAANPDPAGDLTKAVELLKEEPIDLEITDPVSGQSMTLPIDNIQFMQILYLGVFVGPLVPIVPYLVTSVAQGDDSVLQMVGPYLAAGGGLSMGATFTYFCQDEVPFSPKSETDAELADAGLAPSITDGSWIGLGDQAYSLCRMWLFPPADQIEAEAVTSDEPILILTGRFDPITPPSYGDLVLDNFPNGQLVMFESQGHDPASSAPDCSAPMITAFLNDPTAEVDGSCAAEAVDFTVPDPDATPVASPVAEPIG